MPLSRERLKSYAKLKQKKYRSLRKQFLLEGMRAVRDIVADEERGNLIDAILYTPALLQDQLFEKMLIAARDRGTKTYEIPEKDLEKVGETVTGQGIVAVVNQWGSDLETVVRGSRKRLLVATDAIREPGNLGSIIRTCDWFGVDGLLFGAGTVEVWNSKVVRSAVGSMVHVPMVEDVDLASALPLLRSRGYRIVGTAVHGGRSIIDEPPGLPAVVIFGNEADGISDEVQRLLDDRITIPKYGRAESLNVGVAAGVILSRIRSSVD
jgi:RNA methyltransferase, TrmH family